MKKVILLIFILLFYYISFSQVTLKRGTNIYIELTTEANSNDNQNIYAVVGQDITDSKTGQILITKGSPVKIKVERKKSKGIGKAGWLLIKPISTIAIDGREILLNGIFSKEGKHRKGVALGLGIGLGLTYLPGFGFFFLMLKGEKIVLPQGSILYDIYIGENYKFNIENVD
ncbi:hypothetical protein [Butyricimonas paravirosa]|uniref:hypothetical protein n=1 Tax=Butyricimonas paravirosa TaxID=1472417 RepID=UPI000E48B328|nr:MULTISPECIES: hypothetical protein [Odoribacteraceae]RGG42878.1 hypothetical protein DWX82_21160 [Odoribacter sp. AF21-41]